MKSLIILSFMFSHLLTYQLKRDYISFESAGPAEGISTNPIYLSKEAIPVSEMTGTSPWSYGALNYTVSDEVLSFVEKTISSTPKGKYEEGIDKGGIMIKIQKDTTVISYFIEAKDSRPMFSRIMSFFKKHGNNKKLIAGFYKFKWPNPSDRINTEYICLKYAGPNGRQTTNDIYISKASIPLEDMRNVFNISPVSLNIVSEHEFASIKKIITLTSKTGLENADGDGIIIKTGKLNAVVSNFVTRKHSDAMLENIMAYLKHRKGRKNLITDLYNLEWLNTETHGIKTDYISIERSHSYEGPSTNVIYLCKVPIPDDRLLGNFTYSPSGLNYVLSGQDFSSLETIINSAPKERFQGKDTAGIIIKIHKNNTVASYFIYNSASMFENILTYLNNHAGDKDLIMDLNNLNWANLPVDSVKNDYIEIEYRGSADKPMYVIWISKKPIPNSDMGDFIEYDAPWHDYTVHNDEYAFIEKIVRSTAHKTFEEKDYNGFKIHIRENGTYMYYFIRRSNSNSLFLKATDYLKPHKRNKDLIQYLGFLRLGNVFPD